MRILILFSSCFLILSSHAFGSELNVPNKVIRVDPFSTEEISNKIGKRIVSGGIGADKMWRDEAHSNSSNAIHVINDTTDKIEGKYERNRNSVARGRDPAIDGDPEKPIDP